MPTYTYVCSECDYAFDQDRSIHDDSSVTACVSCGEIAKKKFTPPSIQFRGGGWGGQR
jgi:putative FmdB family regulatory protein